MKVKLGTEEASEALITDLYLDLRRRLASWAQLTGQTAQARMGYIGQHLVSVVTGASGGKSGARGYDLHLGKDDQGRNMYGEIKTCYRIDQLGHCNNGKHPVAPSEDKCSVCSTTDISRKDDSKWLITIRNDKELIDLFGPTWYYLVLFEFEDFQNPSTIIASIWRVDPNCPGFALGMIDYYFNIKANSESAAPFNLWPHSLKYELMRPALIYRSEIKSDNTITTTDFRNDDPAFIKLSDFSHHARAKVPLTVWRAVAKEVGCEVFSAKSEQLKALESFRKSNQHIEDKLVDVLAYQLYAPLIVDKINESRSKKTKTALDEFLIQVGITYGL